MTGITQPDGTAELAHPVLPDRGDPAALSGEAQRGEARRFMDFRSRPCMPAVLGLCALSALPAQPDEAVR